MSSFVTANLSQLVYDQFFTGSIARSTTRRHLSYSKADFEVFRPATRCTDGGEIWHGGGDRAKFQPHRCNNKGIGPPKLKFL